MSTSSSLQVPIRDGVTPETLAKSYKVQKQAWDGSTKQKEFCAAFTKAMQHPLVKITSCMCLGLGTLSGSAPRAIDDEDNLRSIRQLVVFEESVELLRKHHSISHIYFQEPEFSSLDRTFLESRGYTILHSPASNKVLTEETYLFMPYNPFTVVIPTLKKCYPQLLLGNSFDFWINKPGIPEMHAILKEFKAKRNSIAVPIYAIESPDQQRLSLYYPLP